MKINTVFGNIGRIFIFVALLVLLPVIFAISYGEYRLIWTFLSVAGICLGLGVILVIIFKPYAFISAWDAMALVLLGWVFVCLVLGLVYYFSGCLDNYILCIFETVSGFTTTGVTIFQDVEALPKSILFWRSFTQWIGGLGIILIVIAFLPFLGTGMIRIIRYEVSLYTERVSPKMRDTALALATVYLILTILEVILLSFQLPLFDAICTSLTTMPTGGFCIKNASLAGFNNPYVEMVVAIFMIIAGANFLWHYRLLLKGDVGCYLRNSEFRLYIFIILIAGAISALFILKEKAFSLNELNEALRCSMFSAISTITTTGFTNTDVMSFPTGAKALLIILMFAGGCVGSTSGSIKIRRYLFIINKIKTDLKVLFHPRLILKVKVDGRVIEDEIIDFATAFVFIYLMLATGTSLLLLGSGYDFETSISAVATTIGNVGMAFGDVSSNFLIIADPLKLVLCLVMILGRLEIICILAFFYKDFWRRH